MAITPYSFPSVDSGGAERKNAENAEKKGVLIGLRALLAEKFPQAPSHGAGRYALPLAGGSAPVELPLGAVTELTGSLATGGLFLEALLRATYARRGMMALVDARGCFDPGSLLGRGGAAGEGFDQQGGERFARPERLERLLWVACEKAGSAIKAADLLLRDGNLSTIVLELQMTPLAELRRIPPNTWYRFQRIVEPTGTLFVVLTPVPIVSSAAERLELRGEWSLSAMREVRAELPIPLRQARRAGNFARPTGNRNPPERGWNGQGGRRIA